MFPINFQSNATLYPKHLTFFKAFPVKEHEVKLKAFASSSLKTV